MAQVKQNKGYLQREIKLSWIGNVMFTKYTIMVYILFPY